MEQTTINELILALKGARTYEQLAEDCGGVPTPGRIQQLATKPQNTFPSPDTVRGLARGLRVNANTIISACASSLGLTDDTNSPRIVTMLPPGSDTLNNDQLSAVLAVINQFAICNRRQHPSAA